jgi:two-component system OmpR family sensor kinase/two-component system sensor histidine kinase QseC
LRLRSIGARLTAWLVAVLLLAALALGTVTYRSVLREAERLFDYQLRQMALSVRDQESLAPFAAGTLGNEQLDFVVQVWSVDGRTVYASRLHPALPSHAVLGYADVVVQGQAWRTFGVATRERVIQVAQPQQIRQRLAAEAALRSVVPLLALAPLLAFLLWWTVRRSLAPLNRLAREVRQRDAESLAPLPVDGVPEEAAPLVASLNALLQRLDAAFDAQRAFVADAAHELRSPLTALRLQIGTLRRASGGAQREAALDALGAGIERASRMVEQLLTLARSGPGAPALAQEDLDLGEVVRDALADSVAFAASRSTTIELDAQPGVSVRGDRAALASLVRNLADNAVRYAPPGARVVVRVERDGAAPVLTVDDSGPGLSPEERLRAFDRFWRREPGGTPGSGLGLAIVRSVAERHRATVSLDTSPLGGLRVVVRFPAG